MPERQNAEAGLRVLVDPARMGLWRLLLQDGFAVEAPVGGPVGEFLRQGLGLDQAYVEQRCRTIFHNGHPVDDMERGVVEDGDSVVLSAAMPGVVGIAMRRGSPLAAMRSGISLVDEPLPEAGAGRSPGTVSLKLFNLVLCDLGEALLARGVKVRPEALLAFFNAIPEHKGIARMFWRGAEVSLEQVKGLLPAENGRRVPLVCQAAGG